MFTGKNARGYDEWYQSEMGSFVDILETRAALELFAPLESERILDAGCGTGNFSMKLSSMGCHITGIDISSDMLAIARDKADKEKLQIEFLEMDIYKLAFPDNCFDGVFSMAAFEFIKEPQKAYSELFRVVKPGGKLLIGTINRSSKWGQLYMEIAQKDKSSVFCHAHFKNMDELKQLDQSNLQGSRESVFIPPDADNSLINLEAESRLSRTEAPGFILALWRKPL